jgi:catechol 2,3-dioxygenase-like lactoylglutathione lyase family enzyme
MSTEVIGIDHVYFSVRSLEISEAYYDTVLGEILGFRKNAFHLNSNPHVQYFNRHFGIRDSPGARRRRLSTAKARGFTTFA